MNKPMNRAAEIHRKNVEARPQFRDESPENPPRHRGRVGQGRHRDAAAHLRLHGQQREGKADEFRVYCDDRGQSDAPQKADGGAVTILDQRRRKKWRRRRCGRSAFPSDKKGRVEITRPFPFVCGDVPSEPLHVAFPLSNKIGFFRCFKSFCRARSNRAPWARL